jgi:hypothetical protein
MEVSWRGGSDICGDSGKVSGSGWERIAPGPPRNYI